MRAVLSSDAVTIRLLSGLNLAERTAASCFIGSPNGPHEEQCHDSSKHETQAQIRDFISIRSTPVRIRADSIGFNRSDNQPFSLPLRRDQTLRQLASKFQIELRKRAFHPWRKLRRLRS